MEVVLWSGQAHGDYWLYFKIRTAVVGPVLLGESTPFIFFIVFLFLLVFQIPIRSLSIIFYFDFYLLSRPLCIFYF